MDLFNRALIVVGSLLVLVTAGAVLLITVGLAQPEQLAPAPWFGDRLTTFTQLEATGWRWTIGVCLALLLVSLALLVFELRPGQGEEPRLMLKQDGFGRVTVARTGVQRLVNRESARVTGVMAARSRVEEDAQGLRILSRITVDPTARVPELTQELQQRVKASVEHHLGRPVAEVSVDAHVTASADRRSPRRVR